MVGVPGFLARFFALDRTRGGDQTRVFGTRPDQGGDQGFGFKIQVCRFYPDRKYSFAGSTGSKKYSSTVLPGPGKTMY